MKAQEHKEEYNRENYSLWSSFILILLKGLKEHGGFRENFYVTFDKEFDGTF